MAAEPSATWPLPRGEAWVFLTHDTMFKPFVLVTDVKDSPTELAEVVAGLDHESYSFLAALRSDGHDVIVLGNDGTWLLTELAEAVILCVERATRERRGFSPLNVLGIGRGAVTSRYGLAKMETTRMNHQTAVYVSYNGSVPSDDDAQRLDQMGSWPSIPTKVKAVSGEFQDGLDSTVFDDNLNGAPNPGGPWITQELGSLIIERLN